MDLKREFGDRQGELVTLLNLCHLLHESGDCAATQRYLTQANDLARELGDSERLLQIEKLEEQIKSQ